MDKNDIKILKTQSPKAKPAPGSELGFGRIFTDHMFLMDYTEGTGWHDPRIVPYQPLSLEPSAMVFHYGQAAFEGLKAYRGKGGETLLFRPRMNFDRQNSSNARLCMPELDVDFALEALKELLRVEQGWIPSDAGTSLYIRPFVIATDPFIGVRPSDTYLFIIVLSPVGAYYPEGLAPVKINVETEYVRAVRGGLGFTKAAANYAASLKSQSKAKDMGYTQVLWLDAIDRKFIEEVGTMNVFFKIAGSIVTPSLTGSVLPGVTRDSTIRLLRHFGYNIEERPISIDEVVSAYKTGALEEAFGTGTAAVISPIGVLAVENEVMELSGGKIGELSQKLYDSITGIQLGEREDIFGWVERV
ncbi:MAG: branched-chain amino acid aminotransferase [Oscillospiraceae bacterium]|nr:branched-chain amino acid aminotransferase [Oscillospiraceae bacterium]